MSFNYKIENNILYYSGTAFTGSTQLTSLNTAFKNNTTLTKIMPLEGGTVVTGISNWGDAFNGCTALYSADMSNFDTTSITSDNYIFYNCINLVQLMLPSAAFADNYSYPMLKGAAKGQILDVYCNNFQIGYAFDSCLATKIRVHPLTSSDTGYITTLKAMCLSATNLEEIDLSDMTCSVDSIPHHEFAAGCTKLVTIKYPKNLKNFDSDGVDNYQPFKGAGTAGNTLTVYGDFSQSTILYGLFNSGSAGCNYQAISLSNVTPPTKLTNARHLFYGWKNLLTVDLSKWSYDSTLTASDATTMFAYCTSLIRINLPKFYGTITAGNGLFYNGGIANRPAYLYGDMSNVTDISSVFKNTKYKGFDFSNVIPSSKLTNISNAFNNNPNLTEIDLSNFAGTDIYCQSAFESCPKLITLKLPKIIGNVGGNNENYGVMRSSGTAGLTLKVYGDLSECTGMWCLFKGTNYSAFDLSNVTPSTKLSSLQYTFAENPNLTEIDLSNFAGTDIYCQSAFESCPKLITLKLPKIIGNVGGNNENYGVMRSSGTAGLTLKVYGDLSECTGMWCLFKGTNYSVLDLSSITIPKTKNNVKLRYTFEGNTNLTTIYCENLYTGSSSQDIYNTFNDCSTNLVGGNGTVWNSSNVSGSYAVVDAEGSAGYFTAPIPEATLTINMDPADSCSVRVIESHQPIKSEFTWRVIITANDGYIYNYSKMADQPKLTMTTSSFYINRFEGGDYTLNIKATKITKEYKENPKEYLDTLPSDDVPESTIGDNIKISDYGLYKLFIPTGWQLIQFINILYDNNFIKTITELWATLLPLSDLIISAQLLPYKPEKSGETTVKVGWADSGVSMYYYDQQFATIDMGTVTVPRAWGNFLDYNPFTTIMIYLPFIGLKELENDDTIGKALNLKYKIDLLSGDCVALIMIDNQVKAQFTGNCAYRIPLKENNLSQMALSGIKAAVGVAATVGAGAVMGPAATTLAGLSVAMGSDPVDAAQSIDDIGMAQYVISSGMKNFGSDAIQSAKQTYQNPTTRSVDNMGGNQAYCGVDTPYIIVGRSIPDMPDNFAELNGFTSNRQAYLYELKGYTEVYTLLTNSLTCTQNEKAEIESLLKKGVIL